MAWVIRPRRNLLAQRVRRQDLLIRARCEGAHRPLSMRGVGRHLAVIAVYSLVSTVRRLASRAGDRVEGAAGRLRERLVPRVPLFG